MNKERRAAIKRLVEEFDLAINVGRLKEIKEGLETLRDEEQEYYDNMPEGLQGGDKGQAAEAAVSALEAVVDEIDNIIDNIVNIIADVCETACEV